MVNKLLSFIETLYKQLDWAIGTDPELIASCVKDEETVQLVGNLIVIFERLPGNQMDPEGSAGLNSNPLRKFGFQFMEQKRLTSKLLTMLSRDFQAL